MQSWALQLSLRWHKATLDTELSSLQTGTLLVQGQRQRRDTAIASTKAYVRSWLLRMVVNFQAGTCALKY
ncbi:hypothetical protein AV530_003554 [Patagioenas fasciata monilis]|uniref:Uncharacterized protein n=1 Tax=Patagioenas fasciata monilis TaxID=372326 RepID=A0A1V4K2T6_PATFA|nr:hypothetical protein AV530_003554 [Patagioenas fasciata monilis]